ncbi:MAG: hypothetical protein LBM68_00565, partial [Bacteroidales bacterium]|nr:hypothetical protein [Bacteroidales bacterium]
MKTTFCKTSCLLLLLFSTAAVAFGVCADSSATESVVINGVRWATRNVAEPGTFAANPEDAGMFYQWNRKTARAVTGSVTSWDNSYPTGIEWEKANDPCPAGYRVPTLQDQASLLDKPKVTNEW